MWSAIYSSLKLAHCLREVLARKFRLSLSKWVINSLEENVNKAVVRLRCRSIVTRVVCAYLAALSRLFDEAEAICEKKPAHKVHQSFQFSLFNQDQFPSRVRESFSIYSNVKVFLLLTNPRKFEVSHNSSFIDSGDWEMASMIKTYLKLYEKTQRINNEGSGKSESQRKFSTWANLVGFSIGCVYDEG